MIVLKVTHTLEGPHLQRKADFYPLAAVNGGRKNQPMVWKLFVYPEARKFFQFVFDSSYRHIEFHNYIYGFRIDDDRHFI